MDWVVEILKVLAGGILGLLGTLALLQVQRKAANVEHQFGVSDRWQGWATNLEKSFNEQKVEITRLQKQVRRLTQRLTIYETTIAVALDWIERTINAMEAAGFLYPDLPERIRQMLKINMQTRIDTFNEEAEDPEEDEPSTV